MTSRFGWIIAIGLVALFGIVMLIKFLGGDSTTPPEASREPNYFDLRQVAVSPAEIFGTLPDGAGNAGDDYKQAVDLYNANHNALERAKEKDPYAGKYPAEETMKIMENIYQFVAAGAAKKSMQYLLAETPKELPLKVSCDPAEELWNVGTTCLLLAYVRDNQKREDEYEKILRDVFFLGWHMVNERSRSRMVMAGVKLQGEAAARYQYSLSVRDKEANAKKIDAATKYLQELETMRSALDRKWNTVWLRQPQAGDLFAIVRNDQDRAWRVDALLYLGVVRFTAGEDSADAKMAVKLLKDKLEHGDALEKAAAQAGLAATRQVLDTVAAP